MQEFEKTFDDVAAVYDSIRPEYMQEIYQDIFQYQSIGPDSRVLEIGIGTGKATAPILEKKCRLLAVEPGSRLASIAEKRFKKYNTFSLYQQRLQDFLAPSQWFDLIYSATAFHWIPEEYGYQRVFELLKKGGAFARFAYHAGQDRERAELSAEIQKLYRKYMGHREAPKEYGEKDAFALSQIAKNYGFTDLVYKLYHTKKSFTADEYLKLLATYPDHRNLEKVNRNKLFTGIHSLIEKSGGRITVYYTMDLQLARKEGTVV